MNAGGSRAGVWRVASVLVPPPFPALKRACALVGVWHPEVLRVRGSMAGLRVCWAGSAPVACALVPSPQVGPRSSSVAGPKMSMHAGMCPNPASTEPREACPLLVLGHRSSPFTVTRAGPTNIDATGGRDAYFRERDDDQKKLLFSHQ